MISDVQSIMGAPEPQRDDSPLRLTAISSKKSATRKQENTFKKPEGMHRELFNLLSAADTKDIQSIMPTQVKSGYRQQKAQIGLRQVRRYKWAAFDNQARSDGLKLFHWEREDKMNSSEPYIFARFNKVIEIPTYSDEEYAKHLKTTKWTKEETDYLFEVAKRFDLRWPIVHDRYDQTKFGVTRSIEDLKERFYSIAHEIVTLRDPTAPPICFDADHERRRKEQLNKQWQRTQEELDEEEELIRQLKNIEARKKERERKAQDLQKLITMTDAPCSPALSGGMSPAISKKKGNFRLKTGSLNGTAGLSINPADIAVVPIRFPEFKTAGAHLRSQEMKLPTNVGQKKLNNIEAVLRACHMERLLLPGVNLSSEDYNRIHLYDLNPMGTEEAVGKYNDFRTQIMLLQELKSALSTAEFELESLKNRLSAEGKAMEIEPRMRVSTIPDGGFDESVVNATGDGGAPTTSRRLTAAIDASNASGPGAVGRPRKKRTLAVVNRL